MKPIQRMVIALLLALGVASDATASDLTLSSNFHVGQLQEMPATSRPGLRFERRDYVDDNAIEWQVRLQAPTNDESPLYEDLNSADFVVRFPVATPMSLHWSLGSHAEANDFQPRVATLSTGKPLTLQSFGGRSSDGVMPYFNLAGEHGGLIVAIGWSGDWKSSFEMIDGTSVRVVAGLKRSRFKLRVDEQVRLPSILVMGYRGSWIDGQNQFRRLTLKHFTPASHAPMKLMPVAASVHGMLGFNDTTEANLIALAKDIAALRLPIDTFWLDAGWNQGGFPGAQGNPDADPMRFPHGLGPVGQAVKNGGLRFVVWFEPERAMRGTWLDREHPGWLSMPTKTPPELHYMENDGFKLVDLGNAEVRRWALDSVSKHLKEAQASVYRQDFNEYPSYFWHNGEAPDEVGLREVRYINGLYDFLDELTKRHPGLILDNCASGGRRIDFEMTRRSVCLWRSDSCWDAKTYPRNVQAMTHGLSHWMPLHGLGSVATDDVSLRSGMGGCASFAANFRDPKAVAELRGHLDRYLKVRSFYTADFYPLTEWSDDPSRWLAFQFHDPATDRGLVQAFSGPNPTQGTFTVKLHGLIHDKRYAVTDWDKPTEPVERTGQELSTTGIELKSSGTSNLAIVLQYALVKNE